MEEPLASATMRQQRIVPGSEKQFDELERFGGFGAFGLCVEAEMVRGNLAAFGFVEPLLHPLQGGAQSGLTDAIA